MAAPITDLKTITHLRELGSLWQKDGKSRIYINDLPTLYGLSVQRYKTGNVQGATLRGQKLSNTKADKLLTTLTLGKVYFDLEDGQFHGQGLSQSDFDYLVTAIRSRLEAIA